MHPAIVVQSDTPVGWLSDVVNFKFNSRLVIAARDETALKTYRIRQSDKLETKQQK